MLLLVRRSITRTSHNTRARHFEHCTTHEGTSSAMCTLVTKDARRPVGSGSVCKEEPRKPWPKERCLLARSHGPTASMSCRRRSSARAQSSHVGGRATGVVGARCSRSTSQSGPCRRRCTETLFDTRDMRLAANASYGPRSTQPEPSTRQSVWSIAGVAVTQERQRCTKVFDTHGLLRARGRPGRENCVHACARRARTHTRTTKTKAYFARGDRDSLCFMTLLWATCGRTHAP